MSSHKRRSNNSRRFSSKDLTFLPIVSVFVDAVVRSVPRAAESCCTESALILEGTTDEPCFYFMNSTSVVAWSCSFEKCRVQIVRNALEGKEVMRGLDEIGVTSAHELLGLRT